MNCTSIWNHLHQRTVKPSLGIEYRSRFRHQYFANILKIEASKIAPRAECFRFLKSYFPRYVNIKKMHLIDIYNILENYIVQVKQNINKQWLCIVPYDVQLRVTHQDSRWYKNCKFFRLFSLGMNPRLGIFCCLLQLLTEQLMIHLSLAPQHNQQSSL